jgi:hypothetical protein
VNYTSSALRNEAAGSHMAVLAIGYPRLLRLIGRQGTPTMDFFVWDIGGTHNHYFLDYLLTIIQRQLYRIWWALPRLIAATRNPEEIILSAQGWSKGTFDNFRPDRSYRLHYLQNSFARLTTTKKEHFYITLSRLLLLPVRLALGIVVFLESLASSSRNKLLRKAKRVTQAPQPLQRPARALVREAVEGTESIENKLERRRNKLVATTFWYGRWLNKWKAGALIVGYNNIGEIHFRWTPEQKEVIQSLWWWRPDTDDDDESVLQKAEYSETLELPAPEIAPPLP